MNQLFQHVGTAVYVLKTGLSIVAILLVIVLCIGVFAGWYRTYLVEHRENHKTFRGGRIPSPLPNGFYKGKPFRGFDWQGKVFDGTTQSGINRFASGERFTFKTYEAAGLRDKDLRVLKIDYKQPGNPWWLGFIADEIVETSPGHYLGKVHLKLIPGLPITLTYFELTKQ